jgi:GNAT superfamily N-acetyltransferase
VDYARLGHRCAMERVVALADLPAVSTRSGPRWLAVRTGAASNDLNAVVSTGGFVPDSVVLEELRSWWNGASASWLVDAPDEALTRVLRGAGWLAERTGRWCGRPLGRPPYVLGASVPEGVALDRVTDDEDLEQWLDVACECGWIAGPEDRVLRRDLLRGAAGDPRQATWLARVDDRPAGMARGWCSEREPVVEVVDVAVSPSARRHGIGTALVSEVLAWAATRGAQQVVAAPSPDGWRLFDALGFQNVPVVPDVSLYWPG